MTGKQRMMAALRREPVDLIPASPILYFMFPMRHSGRTAWNLFGLREPFVSTMKTVVDTYRHFGFESWYKCYLDVPARSESESQVRQIAEDRIEVSTLTHWPHGDTQHRYVYARNDAEWLVEFPIKDPVTQEQIALDMLDVDAVSRASYAPVIEALQYTGDDGIVTASAPSWWSWWLGVRGSEQGLMDLYLYPEVMGRIYQRFREYARAYARLLARSPADAIYNAGGSYTTLSLISPAMWEDFVFEPLRDFCQTAHESGKPLCYFAGNIGLQLVERLAAAGVDAVSPCERPPLGDWRIPEIRRRVGHRICIVGNVDPINTLYRGTPEAVRNEVREVIRDSGGSGTGLILATSDQVCRDTPYANLFAFQEARNRYGRPMAMA